MSADTRSPFTDALETLGSLIDESQARDAIHLAVEPTVAKVQLHAGQHVGVDGSTDLPHVGIVDPFLRQSVYPGERFWLVVYPRQISSLRHVWSHPAFDDVSAPAPAPARTTYPLEVIDASKDWIECNMSGGWELLCNAATKYLEDGSITQDWSAGGYVPPGFWVHYAVITGNVVPESKQTDKFITCCG